ncbi:MAG: hypothetical protein VX288_08060, partial [Planctomycetota bacterium]|nr:hypothetical protein [Planctomycetota bacterium]
ARTPRRTKNCPHWLTGPGNRPNQPAVKATAKPTFYPTEDHYPVQRSISPQEKGFHKETDSYHLIDAMICCAVQFG